MRPLKKRKRQEVSRPLQDRLVDKEQLGNMLRQKCKACKRPCLKQFLEDPLYTKLFEFREHWKDTHKLDQDRIAA